MKKIFVVVTKPTLTTTAIKVITTVFFNIIFNILYYGIFRIIISFYEYRIVIKKNFNPKRKELIILKRLNRFSSIVGKNTLDRVTFLTKIKIGSAIWELRCH